jgi:outer membrane protein assembly factor BamB
MEASTVNLVLAAVLALVPQDYPTFRGVNRDGHSASTGLARKWPEGGPKLDWQVKGIGGGYASVIAVGDKLYTIGDIGNEIKLVCLGAADGKVVWTAPVGKAYKQARNPDWWGARPTPSSDGKVVIALGDLGDLVCVDAASGKEKWRKHLKSDFGGKVTQWEYSESPLIDGDQVALICGGEKGAVVALKKETGELVWQSKEFTDGAEYTCLVPAELGGVRQYVAQTMKSVAGVSAKDGKLLWRADFPGNVAVIPTPIVKGDMVFASCGYNIGHVGYKISAAGGAFKAEKVYEGREMINHHGGVILVGDHLYGISDKGPNKSKGVLRCMELKTGKVVWETEAVSKGSIAYADGLLVCRSEREKGTVVLVEASPTGFKELGRFEQPGVTKEWPTWAHPTIANGKLYLRDYDLLLCYDLKGK